MLHNRSTLLKLENKIFITIIFTVICARRINEDNVVAGNNARSHVWTVYGGSDAIVPSYGPILIFLLLGFHGGG